MPKVTPAQWLTTTIRADLDALTNPDTPNPASVQHHIDRHAPHAAHRELTDLLALIDEHTGEHACTDSAGGATCSITRALLERHANRPGIQPRWLQ